MKNLLALCVFAIWNASIYAQSSTWIALGGGSWSNGSNWSGGVAPVSGPTTDLIFPMSIDPYGTTNDNPGTFVLRTITIGNDTRTANPVTGNPIQFAGTTPGFIITGPRTSNILSTSIDLTGATSITGTAGSGKLIIPAAITGAGSLIINRPTTNFVGFNELTSTTANSFSGGLTLQSGIVSVSQGGNVGTGMMTIATTGTGLNATGDLRGTAATTFNVPVNINNGATLNVLTGSQLNFGQAINGAGGVHVGTPMLFVPIALEGNNGFTGRTDMDSGRLTLRGTTGALSGSTLIQAINGGTLLLDSNAATTGTGNTAGNHVTQNRIRDDAVINLHRSNFDLVANANSTTTETVGTVNGSGASNFRLTPQTNAGAVLTIGNLVRADRGTFEFRASNLGTATPGTANASNILLNQINGMSPSASLVGGGGAAGSTIISIIPFATGSLAAGSFGSTLVTYGANGLRNLDAATEYATSLQEVPYASGASNNVRLGMQVVGTQPVTANSLGLSTSNAGVYGFGGLSGRVRVTSGAIFSPAAGILGVAEVDFDGREAVMAGGRAVHSALLNANGLTVSGAVAGPVLLSPNSSIAGTISVNSGLIFNNQSQLGGATALNINGGILEVQLLATGAPEVLNLPISVNPGGARLSLSALGSLSRASHVALTGPLSGSGSVNLLFSTGTLTLSGDNSAFSGPLVVNNGFVQFDSPARLGTNSSISLGTMTQFSTPGVLHPTASMTLNKNIYLGGFGEIRVDAGSTVTLNGFITGVDSFSSNQLHKMGTGELILTGEATYFGGTMLGDRTGDWLNVGGTLTLRDQGAILNTGSAVGFPPTEFVVNAGSTLVADNTGSANLSNRLSLATMELGGGAMVLRGSPSAASNEFTGRLVLAASTGSMVEVIPGAGQTAALFFNDQTSGITINAGSTAIFRSPGLGGTTPDTGQINFIPSFPGFPMVNGVLPGVFGEDSGATPAVGFVRVDTIPATATFPQHSRSRLLTASEYTLNTFPDSGIVTTNHRQSLPAAPTGSPQVNSLYLDVGGSLAIGAGNTVQLTSGNLLMANGTSVTGSAGFLATSNHFNIYVPSGGTATLGANLSGSSRVVAKTGAGTLELTTAISGATPPIQYAVQRGALRFGTGGSIPATSVVRVEAGALLDVNGSGATIDFAALNGLGTVQLGANPSTVLRLSPGAGVTSLFGGAITGSGSIEKAGAGTLQFGPTASYNGAINLTAGTLRFGGDDDSSPAVPIVAGGTIIAADGTTISTRYVRDFQRSIAVNQGAAVGSATLIVEASGLMKVSGGINVGVNKTLVVGASTSGLVRFSGPITGNGSVNYGMRAIIDGNNTYAGTTTIATAGVIGVGSDTAFGNGGTVSITNPASMVAVGGHRTISNPINLNADLTFGTNDPIYQGFNLTFSGPATLSASRTITTTAAGRLTLTNVSGSGFDLTKAGGGSLALAGTNSYSGATQVTAGTLLVNGTLSAGGGAVTVASGAWLGGTGTINRAITINSGGFAAPGVSPGQLTVGGSVTMTSGSRYFWELNSLTTAGGGTNWDRITMTSGDLSVAPGAMFVPAFIGTATLPNSSDVFWQSTQRWDNIIDLTGTATNNSGLTAFTIDNSAWTAFGTFSTIPAVAGNGIALVWTPVPEPVHVLLFCVVAATGRRFWKRFRQDMRRRERIHECNEG